MYQKSHECNFRIAQVIMRIKDYVMISNQFIALFTNIVFLCILQNKDGYEDIRWHFIGKLQRNKVNNLLGRIVKIIVTKFSDRCFSSLPK